MSYRPQKYIICIYLKKHMPLLWFLNFSFRWKISSSTFLFLLKYIIIFFVHFSKNQSRTKIQIQTLRKPSSDMVYLLNVQDVFIQDFLLKKKLLKIVLSGNCIYLDASILQNLTAKNIANISNLPSCLLLQWFAIGPRYSHMIIPAARVCLARSQTTRWCANYIFTSIRFD